MKSSVKNLKRLIALFLFCSSTQIFSFYEEIDCQTSEHGMVYQITILHKSFPLITALGQYHLKLKMWKEVSDVTVINRMANYFLEDEHDYTVDTSSDEAVLGDLWGGFSIKEKAPATRAREFKFNFKNNKSIVTMKIKRHDVITEVAFNECKVTTKEE